MFAGRGFLGEVDVSERKKLVDATGEMTIYDLGA
jgi:hypothetical protein